MPGTATITREVGGDGFDLLAGLDGDREPVCLPASADTPQGVRA